MIKFPFQLLIYIYQKTFLSKKVSSTDNKLAQLFLKIQKPHMRQDDSKSKIYFLMVIAAYFDFIEFIMSVTYLPEYEYTSTYLEMRLSGVITISSALIYYGLLKFPIFKHQLVSLVIIGICIILLIISEIIFQSVYLLYLILISFL